MRILVLSDTPWSHDNSFGNSFSNIFEGIENIEVANIACRPGKPTSYLVKRYFQITERSLLNNLKNKNVPSGKELEIDTQETDNTYTENITGVTFGKKRRWQILFWARDLIWKVGRWKSKELVEFIDDFKPDLIFQPVYFSSYLNDIAYFIKKHTNVPMLGYISDDCYTLKQFSLSPLYWIARLFKRRKVKRTIEQCEILYVISDVQKREYEKIFTPPCKILTKGADFSDERKPDFREPGEVLKIVYAGNVSRGRYQILSYLADAIKKINADKKAFELDIYTATPLNKKQMDKLDGDSVHLHPPVSYAEVRRIQSDSDILLHAEGFSLRERLAVHQSFSTKIVDYLETNRCVLAIGSDYCASIDYFIKNNCGVVARSVEEIRPQLEMIYNNREIFELYANAAWECGKANHDKARIKQMLYDDIIHTVNRSEKE